MSFFCLAITEPTGLQTKRTLAVLLIPPGKKIFLPSNFFVEKCLPKFKRKLALYILSWASSIWYWNDVARSICICQFILVKSIYLLKPDRQRSSNFKCIFIIWVDISYEHPCKICSIYYLSSKNVWAISLEMKEERDYCTCILFKI